MLTDIFPGAVDEGEEAVELAGKPGERDGWCCNLLGAEERTFGRLQLAEEQDLAETMKWIINICQHQRREFQLAKEPRKQ